ncbi:MAG: hypothetical protein EBX40_02580 [Gammaproteobacteria bacterium]|nr:hypothetical protein [Gammaproteobacteria bacterium]
MQQCQREGWLESEDPIALLYHAWALSVMKEKEKLNEVIGKIQEVGFSELEGSAYPLAFALHGLSDPDQISLYLSVFNSSLDALTDGQDTLWPLLVQLYALAIHQKLEKQDERLSQLDSSWGLLEHLDKGYRYFAISLRAYIDWVNQHKKAEELVAWKLEEEKKFCGSRLEECTDLDQALMLVAKAEWDSFSIAHLNGVGLASAEAKPAPAVVVTPPLDVKAVFLMRTISGVSDTSQASSSRPSLYVSAPSSTASSPQRPASATSFMPHSALRVRVSPSRLQLNRVSAELRESTLGSKSCSSSPVASPLEGRGSPLLQRHQEVASKLTCPEDEVVVTEGELSPV